MQTSRPLRWLRFLFVFDQFVAGAAQGKPFVDPIKVSGYVQLHPETKIDLYAVATVQFPGGILGQLACGVGLPQENGLHVSAGYLYTENSTPDSTYTPALPDSNRSFYSAGLGYTAGNFSFDLAWHYSDGGTRTVSGSPPSLLGSTADGKYKNSLNAISASAGWRF